MRGEFGGVVDGACKEPAFCEVSIVFVVGVDEMKFTGG